MSEKLIKWDIYEIRTETTLINGVMLRGRIRKLCLENGVNVLVENTEDIENSVRFAVPIREDSTKIEEYVLSVAPDANIKQVMEAVVNPVLSKLKVNQEDRYIL